ncbi:hypothetical protein N7474_004449 [Penicillium riverlandense]|uniref:uncharacterized protein n=1 Tax=Penicillium riverlandense TaxID=1903569 RepID=UPI0025498BA1|nr:uncharacterized protein N7474_004449 [Penicillium riverlandense]KAJ5818858.1 hypothetical protein N7474_004449 [Penicillium riverlandense]
MSGLLNSRWAPGAREHHAPPNAPSRFSRSQFRSQSAQRSSPTTATPSVLSPSEELARFMKIVSRLRWKLPFLAEGYRLATQSTEHAEVSHAEIMFKIDFHEYYALLERAIVHLLGVFNITVSSSFRGTQMNGNGRVGVHRYHANVLEALEEETSPLSPVLGSGHVLKQLKQAKELRNRWKTADMTQEEREKDPVAANRAVMPLASYDFETILTEIFGGLEEAYVRAREHVDKCRRPEESTESPLLDSEADWEFMVDAMDWEAV